MLLIQETNCFREKVSAFAEDGELVEDSVGAIGSSRSVLGCIAEDRSPRRSAPVEDLGLYAQVHQEDLHASQQSAALRGQRYPRAVRLRTVPNGSVGSEKRLKESNDRFSWRREYRSGDLLCGRVYCP